jgi:hypothetical protein
LPILFNPRKNAFIAQDSEVKSNFARGAGGIRAEKVDIIGFIRSLMSTGKLKNAGYTSYP